MNDRDESPQRLARLRRRPWLPAALLVLLFLLIALVPRHSSLSRTLPAGRWGATIACLERDGGFRITDTQSGAVPSRITHEVTVTRTIRNVRIAFVENAGTATAARAVVDRTRLGGALRRDYRRNGPIVWAYVENGTPLSVSANAGEQQLIGFCAARVRR